MAANEPATPQKKLMGKSPNIDRKTSTASQAKSKRKYLGRQRKEVISDSVSRQSLVYQGWARRAPLLHQGWARGAPLWHQGWARDHLYFIRGGQEGQVYCIRGGQERHLDCIRGGQKRHP